MLTEDQNRDQLLLHFDAELSRLRFELLHQLGMINVLNGSQRDQSLKAFCQRLEVMQYDFLRLIQDQRSASGAKPRRPDDFNVGINPSAFVAFVAACAAVGGGYAAADASRVIVFETLTKGFWRWKTTTDVTIAAKVAALLGISTAHAILLIGVLGGLPAFFLTQKLTKPLAAKLVRNLIIRQYDETIAPQLREWAWKQLPSA